MKKILAVCLFLVSHYAVASNDVDEFLFAYGNMDKVGHRVFSDYRAYVVSECSRDVTVKELRSFSNSAVYMKLSSLLFMNGDQTPDYQSTLAIVT